MKYIKPSGALCVSSEGPGEFTDFMAAVMACNAVQLFYASQGFSVHSDICTKTKVVEVRIHFDSFVMPTLPSAYHFTTREITSIDFISSMAKPGDRVRVMTYYFEF